ncbi:sigma-54-dependent Fis family transcriptional regulator, partial [bacterium]|nr:sigma-54-dependent Fis family transcriptional regulator [bacterium]
TNAPVLITGESGTGKELAARALHTLSRRKDDPFVQINCAAIPDTLVESELFGYERGAFTDARQSNKGRFRLAQNGTLFLDEIGDLSLIAQSKILLVLEQQEVFPLGGGRSEKLDVRFIFATNQDLEKMLAEGKFRQDLFYRINVASITLAPLRERREDIVPMAEYFLQRFEKIYPGTPKKLTDDARTYLLSMEWEGNVRQVRNVMEKISILSNADKITARLLKNILEYKGQEFNPPSPTHETLHAARENFERTYIQSIMNELNGNVQQTAAVLGLNRSHLYRKLEQLGIEPGKPLSAV